MQQYKRHRLNIPIADEVVIKWLENQTYRSLAMRIVIRSWIEENGMADVTVVPVFQKAKRGRPVKAKIEDDDYPEEPMPDTKESGELQAKVSTQDSETQVREAKHAEESKVSKDTNSNETEDDTYNDLLDQLIN